jgi:hypothetical protein
MGYQIINKNWSIDDRAVSRSAHPMNLSIKPRFLHLLEMKKAGQAAGYFSSREGGINWN